MFTFMLEIFKYFGLRGTRLFAQGDYYYLNVTI
jgi:hypothetical protein